MFKNKHPLDLDLGLGSFKKRVVRNENVLLLKCQIQRCKCDWLDVKSLISFDQGAYNILHSCLCRNIN